MNRPVPLTGQARTSFEWNLRLWAVKSLWRGVAAEPRMVPARIRTFMDTDKRVRTYMSKLKPVRFGRHVKMGLYLPHWPSQALKGRLRREMSTNGLPRHEQVMISVTDDCPYKCPHCFNYRKPQPPMSVQRLQELVGEIQQVGGSWIAIHGGEPLVEPDRAMAVVEAADERSEVWLATTGLNLDAGAAREFKELGLFGACVSVHHHRPAEHDAFVGYPGAFRIALDAIDHFKRAGVFVVVNTALPQERIRPDEISPMMELARDVGAGMVEVLFIRPAGGAIVGCDQMLAKPADRFILEEAMQRFNRDARYADYPVLVSPVYFETPERFGCVAGSERIFISAAGDLQPCAMVNLSVGSVAEESFDAVAGRLRCVLPCPRKDLLCVQLQSMITDRVGPAGWAELPLEPSVSLKILGDLPDSEPPEAFRHLVS